MESAALEWRVFSFEVSPQQLTTALDGLDVLGVRGVLIDKTLAAVVEQWHSDDGNDPTEYTDCLYRDQAAGPFVKFSAQRAWIKAKINEHAVLRHRDIEKTFVVGEIPEKAFLAYKSDSINDQENATRP